MFKHTKLSVSIGISLYFVPFLNISQNVYANAEVAKGVIQLGISTGDGIYKSLNVEKDSDDKLTQKNLDTAHAQLVKAYQTEVLKNRNAIEMETGVVDASLTLIEGVAVTATATPTPSFLVTVPVIVTTSVMKYANKKTMESVAKEQKQKSLLFLEEGVRQQSKADRKKMAEFVKRNDITGAKEFFDKTTKSLSEIKKATLGDPDAAILLDAVMNDSFTAAGISTALELADQNKKSTMDARENLAKYIKETSKQFKKKSVDIENLEKTSNELKKKIEDDTENIKSLAEKTGKELAAIGQVLLDSSPPEGKLVLLNNDDFMSGSLDDETRKALIAKVKIEIAQKDWIRKTTEIATTVQDVSTIFKNLGIKDKNLDSAVKISTHGQQTISKLLSVPPDYIGAVAVFTGLFGENQTDPTLDKLLGMDKKLDEIIELQKQTLEAIKNLSDQLAIVEKNILSKLDDIKYHILTIEEISKIGYWKDNYAPCQNAMVLLKDGIK